MNKKIKLVVGIDKKHIFLGLIIVPIMIAIMLALLFFISRVNIVSISSCYSNLFLLFFIFFTRITLYVLIGAFSIIAVYLPFLLIYNGPLAILDLNGIWIKNYNFIPWKNIKEFVLYSPYGTAENIGIYVKDTALLFKQSSLSGKMSILSAKLFGNYHITLANPDNSKSAEIMFFYNRHIKKHN